jgi:hypothetical protein
MRRYLWLVMRQMNVAFVFKLARTLSITGVEISLKTSAGLSLISARAFLNTLLMLTRNDDGVLLRNQAPGPLRHFCG